MYSMHLYPLKVYRTYQRILAGKQRNNELWTPTTSTAPRASVPAILLRHVTASCAQMYAVQLTSSSFPVNADDTDAEDHGRSHGMPPSIRYRLSFHSARH